MFVWYCWRYGTNRFVWYGLMERQNFKSGSAEHPQIGMIGSGSWATAMIKMMLDNSLPKTIRWWVRDEDTADHLRRYGNNPNYLSAVSLDEVAPEHILTDAREVIQASDILVLNTPATYLKNALKEVTPEDFEGKTVVSAIKGIVPQENQIVGDYLQQHYGIALSQIAVVGGPCHAEEVAQERLSYLTIASSDEGTTRRVADLLKNRYINTILSPDVYGIEYAAVLKNIYAVAGGICHGIGFGDNFQAVLVSNAIREMEHFIQKIRPMDRNIMDSAYLGDLLVTSYSQFSRNRTFGNMIGKGYSVTSAQLEMNMVAEGYYASNCIQSICSRNEFELPICDAVYNILHLHKSPKIEMNKLAETFN